MGNFNKVILLGNLTRDPVLRYLPSNMPVADFGLAVNHKYKTKDGEQREEVCFIDCSVFGKGAEVVEKYCQKGRPLLVEGRLKLDTWEDKQGGGKRSKHCLMVENFQLMGDGRGRGEGEGDSDGDRQERRQPATAGNGSKKGFFTNRPGAENPISDEQQFKEDDIPF